MKISFSHSDVPQSGAIAVGVFEDEILTPSAQSIDSILDGALKRAIKANSFEGKAEQTLTLLAPAGSAWTRVVAVGLGKAEALDTYAWERLGAAVYAALSQGKDKEASLLLDPVPQSPVPAADAAARMASGMMLRAYRFDKYRTTGKKNEKPKLGKVTIHTDVSTLARSAFEPLNALAGGVCLTRDLEAEPANILGPEELAKEARRLEKLGVAITVLGEKEMKKLGMGALLGVGQGSARESQLVIMEWKGGKDKDAPVAMIGKGVTFDSGGISIKPANGMESMKHDMSGAAVVVGLMQTLAARKARANVVGLIGLVENMPSGTAQRPGDVVTSLSGQTIEIISTDAEGRLVLADVLTYVQREYKPKAIVDLATLTGAIVIALGHEYAGLFSNDDTLSEALSQAGKATGEKVWRMPMGEIYDKDIDSDIADMKNCGEREGGSISAAQFLQRFIEKETPWAHIDIAGTSWNAKADTGITPKGATGFGVRLLDRLVSEAYEH